jgi:hypothetical protein
MNMRNLVFSIALFISFSALAQHIIGFNVFPSANSVTLKFTITPGSNCTGYTVLHSLDSTFYNPVVIENFDCNSVYGNTERSVTHSSPVLNQTNHYKIQLDPYYETSQARSVYVSQTANLKMLVYPNPVYLYNDILTLKIFNASNIRVIGFLYDQFGNAIRTLDLTTKVDLTTLETGGLENGVYLIWVTDGNQAFSSKFIIYR